jgi:hypothetical protein
VFVEQFGMMLMTMDHQPVTERPTAKRAQQKVTHLALFRGLSELFASSDVIDSTVRRLTRPVLKLFALIFACPVIGAAVQYQNAPKIAFNDGIVPRPEPKTFL